MERQGPGPGGPEGDKAGHQPFPSVSVGFPAFRNTPSWGLAGRRDSRAGGPNTVKVLEAPLIEGHLPGRAEVGGFTQEGLDG